MVVNTIGGAYAARFLFGMAHGFISTFYTLYLQVRLRIPFGSNKNTDHTSRNVHQPGIADSCCQYPVVL